jgi:hypothetical protein
VPASKTNTEFSELFIAFEELENRCFSITSLHPMMSVVPIAVLAVLCGTDAATSIRSWAVATQQIKERCRELPNGLP